MSKKPTQAGAERLLTTAEVCAMLGISRVSLYRWVRGGIFPAPVSVSERNIRWRNSEVLRWIEQRPIPPAYASAEVA